MKKLNLPLAAGGIIIGVLILIILFPQKFTNFNPYVIEGVKSAIQKNGSIAIKGAPFPPSKVNILGTDQLGRDLLSLIIYGTRLTLELGFLVVMGRFIIAMPLGIAAGFGNSLCKSVINLFNVLFSAIPALIISILVLKISFFQGLYKEQSIIAFAIVLTVVGFGRLARLISERVENILSQPFITGEKAIGKSKIKIAFENILSHLAPELIVLFFIEMALALSMIMELGFFGVYVGNLRLVSDTDGAVMQVMNVSYEPEWASMLASSMLYLSTASWTVLSPAVTFFISIFGFNLFGEGLREELQSKNSKLSVRIKLLKKKKAKAAAYALCLLVFIFTVTGLLNHYKSSAEDKRAKSLINWEFKDSVLLGSDEAEYTADMLKNSLEKAGFQPIGKNYIQNYKIDKLYAVDEYEISIKNGLSTAKLIWGKDFSLSSNKTYNLSGEIFDARQADMYKMKNFNIFDDKFVLLDEETYSRDEIAKLYEIVGKESKSLGVIDIIKSDAKLPEIINKGSNGKALIYISKEDSKYLKYDSKLSVYIKSKSLSEEGRNVIGILPGKNKSISKEAIMVSMGYNYLSCDKENAVEKLEMMIETAKKLCDREDKQGRSIIIAFWDGNLEETYAGVKNYTINPLYPLEITAVNIDLTEMNIKRNSLVLNSQQVPVTRYFAWAFNHEFEQNIKRSSIKIEKYASKKTVSEILNIGPNSQEIMYYSGAVPTILTINKSGNEAKQTKIEKSFADVLVSSITNINY